MIDKRLTYLVVGAALVGALIAGIWAAAQPERYTSEAVLAVGPAADLTTDGDVIDVIGSLDRGNITATAAGIAASRSVRDGALEAGGVAAEDFDDYEIDSVPVLESNLVDITVSGPDPDTAASMVNAVADQLRTRFAELYDVYRVELLTEGRPSDDSGRPSVLLVAVAGALLAELVALAVWWLDPARRPHRGAPVRS